ncbi:hypothetical protein Tco_1546509 [Tanacetum coccineum]
MAQQSCSYCGGPFNDGNYPSCSIVGAENEFVHDPNPFLYDNTPDFYDQSPQHHVETYSCELCGNDSHYGYDCPPRFPLVYEQGPHENFQCQPRNQNYFKSNPCYNPNSYGFDQPTQTSIDHQPPKEMSVRELLLQEKLHKALQAVYEKLNQQEQAANESTIPLNEITSQIPPSITITPVLPTMEPEDSLIMGDENLSTIPEKESDEFIKSSVEDLVPIPRESEDTTDSDKECDLPFCGNYVTFSNPLFNNNDFTSSDDESFPEEDVPEENFKIYSNPLFEFDDEYSSSDVNPLFNEVLEDIECKDSYVSNLDEPILLVTPLSDANEDKCFDPRGDIDEIDAFLDTNISTDIKNGYHDSEGDIIYLESLLIDETIPNLPPKVFLDHDPRSLKDEPDNDDLKIMVKDCPDYEDSRARGFVHRSLKLQSLACLYMGIRYPRSY